MALRLHPSANLDTTPLHLPIAAPLPSQTNTDAGINASKRPRLVDNIITAEYLQHHAQQQDFYEHGSTVDTQLQYHQGEQQQQPDWAALQLQLDAPQQQEQDQFQQLQQLQHSQDIYADGVGFLLPELVSEEVQFVSPQFNHQPLHHPEQQPTPHLNHQHLHHPEEQLSPPSPALAFDPSLTFLHGPLPMSSVVTLPPGAFQQQQQQHPPAVLMPPPPPPTANPHASTPRPPRPPPKTSTSVTAAAALSSTSASAALAYVHASSSSSAGTGGPSACTLRIGGYTLEEAGIKLPPSLSDAERRRRLRIIAEELHHEATHPPVLPPSQVPDLPEKPPPVPLPKILPGMTHAQREATSAEILRLSQAQKRADQSRNNLAAKKSRMLRLECLDNTRLQLDAKSAECIWLRVQIVALSGEPLPRRPSEAWGGFDYVYRARKRRRRRLLTLLEDESESGGGGGPPIKVEEVTEEDGEEEEEEDEPDVEGIVPRRVKEAITEEVRARVEAHKDAVEEESRRKTSASRTAKKSQAAKAEAAKAEAAAKTDKGGRQRRGSGGGKRKQ
ncbi:hypothetical protein BB8028_0002g01050 [Beauveria bassiana]|uniref:Uncharacterized protein n=1 Tax=Beauveria bassiana TaxID=176275 RepID=A0A2S7Y0Y6_BEABA|nr:hypothetical protein BB8028_0002g01050 [Beauveria bassiana]